MKRLLIYGLQRSGTNYVAELLRRRYRVRLLNTPGRGDNALHKHVRPYPDKSLVPEPAYRNTLDAPDFAAFEAATGGGADAFLVISKNPYSWLQSYRRWAERSDWPEVRHHYIEEYAAFYGHWVRYSTQSDRVFLLRYEDLLSDPRAALADLAKAIPLTRRALGGLHGFRPRHVPMSGAFTAERRAEYDRRTYLDAYTPDELQAINRMLPTDLMVALGHAREGDVPD